MNDSHATSGPSANEEVQQEWEAHVKHRDTLAQQLQKQREIASRLLVSEPVTRIQTENSRISQEIRRLKNLLHELQRQIRRVTQVVQRRKEAATNPRIINELKKRIAWAEDFLARLTFVPGMKRSKISEGQRLLAADQQLLADYRGPLSEAEAELQRLREKESSYIRTLQENEERAKTLGEELREVVREAETSIKDTERQLQAHDNTVLQWAVQNRARLVWFIKQQPHRFWEAISLFRQLSPQEDISNILPKTSMPQVLAKAASRKRSKVDKARQEREKQLNTNSDIAQEKHPWVFVLTTPPQNREHCLPEESSDQLRVLGGLLKKMNCSANPTFVLSALARIISLTPQQRTSFNRVAHTEPRGWIIVHAGEFRILCDVNDQERVVRFCIRPRRDVYS